MTPRLRALIFDVDGTLADTEEMHRRAFNAAFAACGLGWWWSRRTYRDLLRIAGGRQRMRAYALRKDPATAARADVDELLGAVHRDKTRRYDRLLRVQPLPLRPGVERLLDEAGVAGVATALATTTTPANLDALLEPNLGRGWRGRFAAIVCGDAVTRLKPAPDAYLEALRRLHVGADAALAFEDSANGVASARAAGLAVILTPTWYSLNAAPAPALVELPHLGDPAEPLPRGAPGAPFVDLPRLRAWHAGAIALLGPGRAATCC